MDRRRSLSLALLAILAVQMLGGLGFASACIDSCPEDEEDASCPPLCVLCTECVHAQAAIVQAAESGAPELMSENHLTPTCASSPSAPPSDVFHVPLPA